MKIFKYLLMLSLLCVHSGIMADPKTTEYYPDYYENEGGLFFKVRAFYSPAKLKNENLPAPTKANAKKPSVNLVTGGVGFDTSTAFFFSDNFATELSLGLVYYRTKKSALNAIFDSYGVGTKPNTRIKNIYNIPASVTLQYHVAPYGGIRPYVGGGYHGTYVYSSSKQFKIKNGHGPVLQGGVDFVARDDTTITLDVRQFWLKSRINYKSSFLNTLADIRSKAKWNPLLISLGIGFRF